MSTEKKQQGRFLSKLELSAFCKQVALMLTAAIPLHEGFELMAEDTSDKAEKEMLKFIADEVELGSTLYQALEKVTGFPEYVIYMTRIGEESGELDHVMDSLSKYYKKEDRMQKAVKEAVTYPIVMVLMMLVILFILMTRVMPVFEQVFNQLGTALSPLAKNAVFIGGVISGALIVIIVVSVIIAGVISVLRKNNIKIAVVEKIRNYINKNSKISRTMGIGRFCNVVSMMMKSGIDTCEALTLARSIAGNQYIEEKIEICEREYEDSSSFSEALKRTGFFAGFNQQMITVGSRTGHLDTVLADLSDTFSEEVDLKINRTIAKFEPTMIAVLSIAVGLILLAVMLPLIGMMVSMG